MKLINPPDDELDAAFAEHVAGWKWEDWNMCGEKRMLLIGPGLSWEDRHPEYTKSADAVLPWLEKCKDRGWWVQVKDHTNGIECGRRDWLVIISDYDDCCDPYAGEPGYAESGKPLMYREGAAPVFAKAAVIALLRAHGVEVEFTKGTP